MVDQPETEKVGDVHRELAAILCADVVGYTGLMAADETATHAAFTQCLATVVDTAIEAYRGRIVKNTGDGFIAVFQSVVDGMSCAIAIQENMAGNRDGAAPDHRLAFRIGVNLGDIIFEEKDVYGDGVNMAARLQTLAVPGGICVSHVVRHELRGKLQLEFDSLGSRRLKSTDPSLEAYRLRGLSAEASPTDGAGNIPTFRRQSRDWIRLGAVAAIVFLSLTAVLIWRLDVLPWQRVDNREVLEDRVPLPLPDKPSLAVLPFKNMSADPEQEYFADGISEDLITDLAKIGRLFVIARNSSFAYKGRDVDVRKVGRDLGVRYVLEGSIRKAGDTVRVNAQLIDAQTGLHVWASRFDRKMRDIFKIQDEITLGIVSAMTINVNAIERAQASTAKTGNFAAYDAFLRGWAHFQRNTFADYHHALKYFRSAIELDPDFSQAHAAIAAAHLAARMYTWTNVEDFKSPLKAFLNAEKHRVELLEQARQRLRPALRNPSSVAYRVQAELLVIDAKNKNDPSKYDEAIKIIRKAILLDPNDADNFAQLGISMVWNGKPEEAFTPLSSAIRINPFHPATYYCYYGIAEFSLKRYADSVKWLKKCAAGNARHHWPYVYLAAAYAYLEQGGEAEKAKKNLERLMENQRRTPFTVKEARSRMPYRFPEDTLRLLVGLHKAGIPNSLVRGRKMPAGQTK